ncbi:adenylate kinase [Paraglaciecola sp.]|uniref:adenylate kinase n=1 Tax=Paraglaciecola sp. TaxID=1920173 RepID=UPI0032643DFB
MQKIAIFGKPANGKSTLSKQLAYSTGIKLHAIDSIFYQSDGEEIPRKRFEAIHESIITKKSWIIEGFGPLNSLDSFYARLKAADTLVYIDLPYFTTYWLVTKRLIKGLFVKPDGWPEGSSIIKGTIKTYKILKACPQFWNDDFEEQLRNFKGKRTIYHIRSISELNSFISNAKKPF